jgi:ferrous iron transport protein A
MSYDRNSEGRARMMTLDTVEIRRQARVILIDSGHGVRAHLNTLGIHVGDRLTVVERAPFRGPVLVEVNGTRVAIGRGIASKVSVDVDGEVTSLDETARAKRPSH